MKKTLILISTVLVAMAGAQKSQAQNANDELVNVYRWYNTEDRTFETVAEGEYQEGQMLNWKWKNKTLIFVAYRNPAPDRVAVYSWYNPTTKDQASIAEDEYTDEQLIKMGYSGKKLQFYALTRRAPNTVCVYRWKVTKTDDWVSIADEGNTDAYLKKGYRHKTFQFFGIARAVDASVYNQL